MGSKTEYTPELLEAWLRRSLPQELIPYSVTVHTVKSEIGFLSTQFRATMKMGDSEIRLFIKTMPPDDLHKGVVANTFCDVTEIETYRVLFRELAAFESRNKPGKQFNRQ